MKRINFYFIAVIMLIHVNAFSQSSRITMAIGDIDANEVFIDNKHRALPEMVILEMNKINKFELLDQYDMRYLAMRDSIEIKKCFSKICLTEIGKQLKVDKMLTGTILRIGDNITVTFRMLDVASGTIDKAQTNEFLNIETEIRKMIEITLAEMYGTPVDEELKKTLTLKNDFDNAVNNPYQLRLRTDGPRMGATMFTGETASILKSGAGRGGFEAQPLMFQFGYQFEKQYLNEGNFQALFEFIPMVTGLDQGLFIPSITIMNGLRNNKSGWEFAFGPTFSVVTKSRGYYTADTQTWTIIQDSIPVPENADVITRLDSRGDVSIQAGFVFAFGKTFKSGRLNVPVNAFVIPNNKGLRMGVSFGFNARDRYMKR
ncbi:MAG: hypothetical protein WED33_13630 [Bacteroidia bacterium]